MEFHRPPRALAIMGLDRGQHGFVFGDHLRNPTQLRQGQAAIAIDVDFTCWMNFQIPG